jgi:hypothetical protein
LDCARDSAPPICTVSGNGNRAWQIHKGNAESSGGRKQDGEEKEKHGKLRCSQKSPMERKCPKENETEAQSERVDGIRIGHV